MSWWRDDGVLASYLTDLIAEDLPRLKPGLRIPERPWSRDLAMSEDGLGIDSLDRLSLAARVAGRLCFAENRAFDRFLALPRFGDWIDAARDGLARSGAMIAFGSSGTTGEPKLVQHHLATLEHEAHGLAAILGRVRRIVSLVPSHHIYGFLFTILLPRVLSVPVLDLRMASSAALAALEAGDVVVSFPLAWSAAIEAVPRFPAGVIGTSSTAPMPAHVTPALRAAGLSRLVEVYGSTETAGIGWRDDPAAPFELMPWWTRLADHEIERDIVGVGVQRFKLPDVPVWEGERHLRPGGRRDGQVQVGGVNVSPERVRAVLLEHAAVADAAVRLMRPDEGDRLKAFVVPRDGCGSDIDELRGALTLLVRERLTAPERPVAFTIGPALPRSSLGKSIDWPIA